MTDATTRKSVQVQAARARRLVSAVSKRNSKVIWAVAFVAVGLLASGAWVGFLGWGLWQSGRWALGVP
jgi:hypothetical protein